MDIKAKVPRPTIGNKVIEDGEPAFVIAEVAGSHEGSLQQAKRLLEVSREVGADAVKFQIFNADELVVSSHPKYHSFKEIEFSSEQWLELLNYSRKLEIVFLADAFDIPSLELMDGAEVGGYKIHLTNLVNPFMLAAAAKKNKPIFLAVGGALPEETGRAIEITKAEGNEDIILMHGYQGYPTKLEEINFRRITTLRESFSLPVGFLDHIDGSSEMSLIIPRLSPAEALNLLGKAARVDIERDEVITWEKVE